MGTESGLTPAKPILSKYEAAPPFQPVCELWLSRSGDLSSLCVSSDLPPDNLCFYRSLNMLCPLKSLSVFFFPCCSLYLDYVSPLFHSCTFHLSFMILFRGHVLCEAFPDSTHFSSQKVVPIYIILVICRTVICDIFLVPCIISSFKDQIIQFFIPEHQVL